MKRIFKISSLSAVLMLSACSSNQEPELAETYHLTGSPIIQMAKDYCVDCHNAEDDEGDLDLESILEDPMNDHVRIWQDVAWMLEEREMPPPDEEDVPMPSDDEFETYISWLDERLNGTAPPDIMTAEVPHTALVDTYCMSCHNAKDKKGGMVLEDIYQSDIADNREKWEKVLRKLSARQMPPPTRKRPSEDTYGKIVAHIESTLNELAIAAPNVGRVETFRRLNRTEYQNSIRDLLALHIDAASLLPADEASHGFDNITVGNLSPMLLNRYMDAAQKIAHLAVGTPTQQPDGQTIRIAPDVTQSKHLHGLPLGTRGGTIIPINIPETGEYDIQVNLARDRNEYVEGLNEDHQMEILVDGIPKASIEIIAPKNRKNYAFDDSKMAARIKIEAGPHELGVTFVNKANSLLTNKRQPYNAQFNFHRHRRQAPAVFQVSINGPYDKEKYQAAKANTPSRNRIFSCYPNKASEELSCAKQIIQQLTQKAYRRALTEEDLATPLRFYQQGRAEGNFDSGIEAAISSILVSPNYLFRVERDPENLDGTQPYRISDTELASRLSFFLWSSLPDEELLQAAIAGELSKPEVLKTQVVRLLADPRSETMVTNFASQWLYLRNLAALAPDFRLYPDFDDNLRKAFKTETEMFVSSVLRSDQSVTKLLKADYTFLNERLAKHYKIPHVYGDRFRRVELAKDSHRGGLLRQGSILTLTSYATRTSPVVRGHWILENLMGTPPPPAPGDVPALDADKTVSESLPVRERLAKHREDPTCAGCHDMMDPVGFALENYDAVGRWRTMEQGKPVDASAGVPNGKKFTGIEGLEDAMLEQPEMFVRTMIEKLMTFALGRGVEYYDAPQVRKIVKAAQDDEYRFSSLILGIVSSDPFTMRMPLLNGEDKHVAAAD